MKKLLIIFCTALVSCGVDKQNNIPTGNNGRFGDFRVVEIDHCEYVVREGVGGNSYFFAITHKGNCKNHKASQIGQSSSINIDGTNGNQIEVNQGDK